jgi:hypothetical protein
MHMIRGVMAPGSGKKKPKKKTASVLAAEKALRDTLARVGYKGGSANTGKGGSIHPTARAYQHDLEVTRDRGLKVGSNSYLLSNAIPGNGTKKEASVYTGTEIAGIAVMHKSNLVPVRRDRKEGFVEISQMRRS